MENGLDHAGPSLAPSRDGRVVGAWIVPSELEAAYRLANLSSDGRNTAIVIGAFTVLSLPFVYNDLFWAGPSGRLLDLVAARLVFVLTGIAAVWVGLRGRHPALLDLSVFLNWFTGALFTVILQSTRPADYYLPVAINAIAALIAWTVVPIGFTFQALGAFAITASCVAWLLLFRTPPPGPVALLIGFILGVSNLAGGFVSWRLNRYRRIEFLSAREREESARQLAVANRLAAMGTLVAGVAHEINNPLVASVSAHGFAAEEVKRLRTLLGSDRPIDRGQEAHRLEEVEEALADARESAARIGAIVKDLTLIGRPDVRRTRVSPRHAVDEAIRWLPAGIHERATFRVEEESVPDVVASEGQLSQILVNLLTNAARAAPQGRKASVRVHLGPGAPGMARIDVVDDGVGMTPEVLTHIFDPFFTTRGVGQGMGLGLAICHAIVTAHGGTIGATSAPGEGSRLRVELPVA